MHSRLYTQASHVVPGGKYPVRKVLYGEMAVGSYLNERHAETLEIERAILQAGN